MGTLEKLRQVIERPGNHDDFFRKISHIYPKPSKQYKTIERAYQAAKEAFDGDIRESGERYFEHLRAVALILIYHLRVIDHRVIAAALLHDISEDKKRWPIERVQEEFGDEIAEMVGWVTNPPRDEFKNKIECEHAIRQKLANAPREAFLIKLADRLHNLLTLSCCNPAKRRRKVEETRRLYWMYAEREKILIHELEEAMALVEEEWSEHGVTNSAGANSGE